MITSWIPVERIAPFISLETFVVLVTLAGIALLVYRVYLKRISEKRHANMRRRFWVLGYFIGGSAILSFAFWFTSQQPAIFPKTFSSYIALVAMAGAAVAIVRLAQAYVYVCLFLASMSAGVPRLIANIFTLMFSLVIAGWIGTEIFGLKLAPVLTTSAIFSVVLGLALQDTLGNFFSGVSFQIDHSFNIGDWIEVHNGTQKWVGQVLEITWRATFIVGFSGELIAIPNKTLAQSQIVLFAKLGLPSRRNQIFRLPLESSIQHARDVLLRAVIGSPGVLSEPAPVVLATETHESWVVVKVFYSIADFGEQYSIGDRVIELCLAALRAEGLRHANPTMELVTRASPAGFEPLRSSEVELRRELVVSTPTADFAQGSLIR